MIQISSEVLVSVISIGVTFVIAVCTWIFGYGKLNNELTNLGKSKDEIKKDLKELRDKINQCEKDLNFIRGSVSVKSPAEDKLSRSNSPRQLSKLGIKVLNDSKINIVVDAHYAQILEDVKSMNPQNSYQAQEAVYKAVDSLWANDDIKDLVEQGAFLSGYTPKDVLFVGGLYIRDKILKDLDLDIEDIDKHSPENK